MSLAVLLPLMLLACAPADGTPSDTEPGASEGAADGPWIHVAVADYFTCALDRDGRPHCWGSGAGAIMGGTGEDPVEAVPGVDAQARIVSHGYQVCSLDGDGVPTCWGSGSLGMDPQPTLDLTLSGAGVCILTTKNQVVCGTSAPDWPNDLLSTPAIQIPDHETSIYCIVGTDGTAHCSNWFQDMLDPTPGPFDEIACGGDDCCGIRTDGTLQCGMYDEDWRYEGYDHAPAELPGPWHGLTAYTGVFCALDAEDRAQCWGLSETWRDALGAPPDTRFAQIDVGFYTACGVTLDGEIECWGRNDAGQLDVPEL